MVNNTKKMIADALKNMMRTTELANIKVTDLCEYCEINRRTFYYHFEDKYALVAWTLSQRVSENVALEPKFGGNRMANSLKRMKQEFSFYKRLYSDPSISNCLDIQVRASVNHYKTQILKVSGRESLTDDEIFSIKMMVFGEIYMIREWFLDDCQMDINLLVKRIVDNIPPWISNYFS